MAQQAQQTDTLDFSGLFKLDVLIHMDIAAYSFYEVGMKKFFAFSSDKELIFIYVNALSERFENNYDWDFIDNPIYCICFEPSGTWVLIVSEQKVLLVPFLPLFTPQNSFDQRWSLSSVTVLPLGTIPKPTSVVCWLTKESETVLIIGSKSGTITFYSLESQSIVGECKVTSEITNLQICFDDSLDLLALLISCSKSQQWKLVLEHRSFGYNWLQQTRAQDRDKKDSFMSYIKQLSKDKITFFIQGGSKDDKSQTVEYVLKPTEYLPQFRKGSNNWALTAQYVNGRHFLTAFELNEGTLILEGPEEETPSRTLRPHIKKDDLYIQGLWSQRIIYLLRKNELEIHSANFSVIQGDGLLAPKRESSVLWSAEVIGDVLGGHVVSAREDGPSAGGWRAPTFLCDLRVPRLVLQPCLIVTTSGAYMFNTVCSPSEWVVGLIMRGGAGAEQSAAALGAPVPPLLRAAADMLLSRGRLPPAYYLYSLSQSPPDGWAARLGVFGRLQELSTYKHTGETGSLSNSAITIKLLAILLKIATNEDEQFDTEVKLASITRPDLLELTVLTAALGLWALGPVFSIHRGHPDLLLTAIMTKSHICRGAINCLLNNRCLVPLLLEEDGQWLFDFLTEKCSMFDTYILKCLCLWMNPLQEQLRPVLRDLKQGITSVYTSRMLNLIGTFMHVASAIESRIPCPEIELEESPSSETWMSQFTPRRMVSCGLSHWAVVDEGNAKIMGTDTKINTDIIGRVLEVACGRHHTLILTENGLYACGDNRYGQLGVGRSWGGGEAAGGGGAPLRVSFAWTAPLTALAAGHYHSAAVDAEGRLYTWGWGVHGQLALGTIDDACTPQLVTNLLGRKVVEVGCGAVHTVARSACGALWAAGAGALGQLGLGDRCKAALPARVALPHTVHALAVGYFHNVALTSNGQLWCWGASPQQVRATGTRRASSPESPSVPVPDPPTDPHLVPRPVDMTNIQGRVVQLSAGWHHSCILNNVGTIYTWGLNFDGQLGSGDRKQIQIPTEVKIRSDTQPDTSKGTSKTQQVETTDLKTKALIACGGDFTIYVNDDGRVFSTGDMHLQGSSEKGKGNNRVIMMKTTKRVIKIPASRNSHKFLFHPIDRIDIMFPFDIDGQRKPIEPHYNPLTSMKDFRKRTWADDIVMILQPWVNEGHMSGNLNMTAKLAYHSKKYAECLKSMLDCLKCIPQEDRVYVTHTTITDQEDMATESTERKDEVTAMITNTISQRIKEMSLIILNEGTQFPPVDQATYQSLPCCCNELEYLKACSTSTTYINIAERNMSAQAASIVDKCISMFPVDSQLWEACFRLAKNFYLDNNLAISDLETVLRKYMEINASTMAAAIMYSHDCTQYSEILTPKFYLNMSSQVLDTWG